MTVLLTVPSSQVEVFCMLRVASVCSLADPKVQRKSYTRARFNLIQRHDVGREIDIEAISTKLFELFCP